MEEFDSHTEHAHEQAHEAAHESREKWITGVALTAALLAALAAITSMLSGHHEHDSMMLQITASDRWNEYQAKKIKTLMREEQIEILQNGDHETDPKVKTRIEKLHSKVKNADAEEEKLGEQAKAFEASARFHDRTHVFLASAVTLFQVAIAVSAISALTRRRQYWLVGIALGTIALGFLGAGLLVSAGVIGHRPEEPKEQSRAVAPLIM
jgi:hypothetical protein